MYWPPLTPMGVFKFVCGLGASPDATPQPYHDVATCKVRRQALPGRPQVRPGRAQFAVLYDSLSACPRLPAGPPRTAFLLRRRRAGLSRPPRPCPARRKRKGLSRPLLPCPGRRGEVVVLQSSPPICALAVIFYRGGNFIIHRSSGPPSQPRSPSRLSGAA